ERALDEAERAFLELGEMEPELALRRMLHRRETAAPEVLADVFEAIMTHAEDEPRIRKSIGPLFVAVKAAMLAYERANGLRALAPVPEPGLRAALPPGRGRRHTGLPAHRMASLRRALAGRRPDGRRAVPRSGGRTTGGQ